MSRKKLVTPAVRQLRSAGVGYEEHHYSYEAGGGAAAGAAQLGLDLHRVVKTLIAVTSDGEPLCVLMHGDQETSLKELARVIGVKGVAMAEPAAALRLTGYQVGGTSPFGLRSAMPIYCERTILDFDRVIINGGKRGFLIEVATADLVAELEPTVVEVAK